MSYLALDSNAWQVSVKIKAPILFAIKKFVKFALRNLYGLIICETSAYSYVRQRLITKERRGQNVIRSANYRVSHAHKGSSLNNPLGYRKNV